MSETSRAAALGGLIALCALPVAGRAADDLLGSAHGGNRMWDYCVGKPDMVPVPPDPRALVNPEMNTGKAVHYNVRWRNCHFDPDAVQEVGPAETCGELRERYDRGGVMLQPGSEGPGGFLTGTAPSNTSWPADMHNDLWMTWGGFVERPANFDELLTERYGSAFGSAPNPYPLPGEDPNQTQGGSGKLPVMFTQLRNGTGGDWSGEITFTCHTCHSGAVGVPGGPGPGVLWGGGSTLPELNVLFRDLIQLGWEPAALVAANLNRTRGRTNASLVNLAFALSGSDDPEVLADIYTSGTTADMDPPAWWNMGHRPLKFVDGIFAMDTPRVDAVFYSPSLSATPAGAAWMRQHGPDLNVWVESLHSPPYPYAIDTELAEEGARLFHEMNLWAPSRNNPVPQPPESNGSCAGCHGAYAQRYVQNPAYLDTPHLEGVAGYLVPHEIIGTDTVRADANNDGVNEAGRDNFFGYPGTKGQVHDCGPQGHPDLNDGRAPGYLAPALYGIWATGPYFHNGSVPNVWEVLKPSERVQIWRRRSKPQIVLPPPNQLASVIMGFDVDMDRAYDPVKLGWRYDEIPCQVESATNPSVSPYVNCNPDPEDQQDPVAEQVLAQFFANVFLGWNFVAVPPFTPAQIEDRKNYNTKMFAQGNEGHEFTAVLSDAERMALIEYLKTL